MAELYPGEHFFRNQTTGLIKVKSITYNVEIWFLPYDLKITENLTPEWNQETVIGRMDPIARFKRMGRTININLKARAKENLGDKDAYLPYDDLLHCVDHLKKLCYPRYNGEQIMTSPPMFRIQHELIAAGEATVNNGVLCYITTLKADPVMDKNTVYYKINGEPSESRGNMRTGVYPKQFDINIGFTVLNENLAEQQVSGILDKKYFYNYSTKNGPRSGHVDGVDKTPENQRKTNQDNLSGAGASANVDAAQTKVLNQGQG